MQLELQLEAGPVVRFDSDVVRIGGRILPVRFLRNSRARRYVLRLTTDGVVRITIPRRGTLREAVALARRHEEWLVRQWIKRQAATDGDGPWRHGTEIWFRGGRSRIEVSEIRDIREIRFGDCVIVAAIDGSDLRPVVESHLIALARRELPGRTIEFAARFGVEVGDVTVRNQRSRWGSCSRQGTISLNWRLVQMPPSVSDYIIIHELAHLRHMNHSPRYWRQVAEWCPDHRAAENWLKRHGRELQWRTTRGSGIQPTRAKPADGAFIPS